MGGGAVQENPDSRKVQQRRNDSVLASFHTPQAPTLRPTSHPQARPCSQREWMDSGAEVCGRSWKRDSRLASPGGGLATLSSGQRQSEPSRWRRRP